MTFDALGTTWWPYVFILLAGWLATDIWRWLGVLLGNRLDETAEVLVYVRCVATALVAAVIAQLVLHPGGALAETPMWLRLGAALAGFSAYFFLGRKIGIGVFTALGFLAGGWLLLGV